MTNIGPRQAKRNVNRARLIEAARQCFDAWGFEKTRLTDISNKARLTTGAIFSNFDGKEALWAEVYGRPYVSPDEQLRAFEIAAHEAVCELYKVQHFHNQRDILAAEFRLSRAIKILEEILND